MYLLAAAWLLGGCQSRQSSLDGQLEAAIGHWETEDAKAALHAGANPNAFVAENGSAGRTPVLVFALNHNNRECAQAILKAGADVNQKDEDGVPLLVHIVQWTDKDLGLLKLALARKPLLETSSPSSPDTTPLNRAISRGNVAVVRELLRAGANPGDSPPRTPPLALALYHPEITRELLAHGAPVTPRIWTALAELETSAKQAQKYAAEGRIMAISAEEVAAGRKKRQEVRRLLQEVQRGKRPPRSDLSSKP